MRSLLRSGAGVTGLVIVVLVALSSILAPWLTPYDPVTVNTAVRMQGPSMEYLLGTDQYGRDTLTRILYGGRTSLGVAGVAVAFSLLIGVILGALAGYYRGWLDVAVMRLTDVILSFPAILLAIALLAFFGTGFQ